MQNTSPYCIFHCIESAIGSNREQSIGRSEFQGHVTMPGYGAAVPLEQRDSRPFHLDAANSVVTCTDIKKG